MYRMWYQRRAWLTPVVMEHAEDGSMGSGRQEGAQWFILHGSEGAYAACCVLRGFIESERLAELVLLGEGHPRAGVRE